MDFDFVQLVVDEINRRKTFAAFNEYPGAVHIPLETEVGFWAGTANPTWTVDLQKADGSECLNSWSTDISSDSEDVSKIADAILEIVEREEELWRKPDTDRFSQPAAATVMVAAEDEDGDEDGTTEEDVVEMLEAALDSDDIESEFGRLKARRFDECGLLTRDAGIVVRMKNGSEFQITVVQSRRRR
jgi:hypothetical protein